MHPARRRDDVSIHGAQCVVVVADAEFTTRQGTKCTSALPHRDVGFVRPAPEARVARGVVHLPYGLHPASRDFFRSQGGAGPAPVTHEFVEIDRLVGPVLAPVLYYERANGLSVLSVHEHHQDVLKADEVRAILDHEHVLRSPGPVRTRRLVARNKARGFDEVEAGAPGARHGDDCAPVALLRRQTVFAQREPCVPGRLDKGESCALRGSTARCHFTVGREGPAEGELALHLTFDRSRGGFFGSRVHHADEQQTRYQRVQGGS